MKKRNKIASFLFLIIMLAGCSPNSEIDDVLAISPPGEYPLVNKKITLDVLVQADNGGLVEDFSTNEFTKWYEEKTNIHINWEVFPYGESEEKLNLVIASGDLPDIFLNMEVKPSTQAVYGAEGVFLSLNELIEDSGYYIKDLFESLPLVETSISTSTGHIYGLPRVNECYHCSLSQRAWINRTWLDNLGLPVPETTEEFLNTLKAFKERDPNGNGIADEIPLVSATNRWNTNLDGFLINPFVFSEQFNGYKYLLLEKGILSSSVTTEGWRNGMIFLNRLYNEGLLSEKEFAMDNTYMYSLAEGFEENRLGVAIAGSLPIFSKIRSESKRWLDYEVLPPLAGPDGKRITPINLSSEIMPGQLLISSSTEYPELAFRWAEGFYDLETSLRLNVGPQDRGWSKAGDDEIGLNGKRALWKRLLPYGQKQNIHWAQSGISYRSNDLRLGEVAEDPENNLEVILFKETKNKMEPFAQQSDRVIPPLDFSSEEALELDELREILFTYILEMEKLFILGKADIHSDSTWNGYKTMLSSLGLDRYVMIHQTTYDRQWRKSGTQD